MRGSLQIDRCTASFLIVKKNKEIRFNIFAFSVWLNALLYEDYLNAQKIQSIIG